MLSNYDRMYTIFAMLWAFGGIFNMAKYIPHLIKALNNFGPQPLLINGLYATCCVIAGGYLLLKPSSLKRLLLFTSIQLIVILNNLPMVSNHWIFMLFIDGTLLYSYLRIALGKRSMEVSRSEFYMFCLPLIRIQVLILFFWVMFHKLNSGFFALDTSCGTVKLFKLQKKLLFAPTASWTQAFSIYATVIIEAIIPVLLFFKRTRFAGVLLASVFLAVLGLNAARFTVFIYALLFLFIPNSFVKELPKREILSRLIYGVTSYGVVIGMSLWFEWIYFDSYLRWTVTLYSWMFIGTLLWMLKDRPPQLFVAYDHFRFPSKIILILPLLLFVNGASPYLGLKNTLSFSMYSNLKTEAGQSNHFLIPASWQIAHYQKDLVTIISSSDPLLSHFSKPTWKLPLFSGFEVFFQGIDRTGQTVLDGEPPTWKLPYFSLRTYIVILNKQHGIKHLELTYERNARIQSLKNAEDFPDFAQVPYLLYKFLLLRPVPIDSVGRCMW